MGGRERARLERGGMRGLEALGLVFGGIPEGCHSARLFVRSRIGCGLHRLGGGRVHLARWSAAPDGGASGARVHPRPTCDRCSRAASAWGAVRIPVSEPSRAARSRPSQASLLPGALQDQIEKVRSPEEQTGRMGVPEAYVDAGHAFHTYTLTSPDGSGEQGGCPALWRPRAEAPASLIEGVFIEGSLDRRAGRGALAGARGGWPSSPARASAGGPGKLRLTVRAKSRPPLPPALNPARGGLCTTRRMPCTAAPAPSTHRLTQPNPTSPCSHAGVQAQRVRARGLRRGHSGCLPLPASPDPGGPSELRAGLVVDASVGIVWERGMP